MKSVERSTYMAIKGLCLLLFLLTFSPYHVLTKDRLLADDASYLAHAFTLGLDFNLNYEGDIVDWKNATGKAPVHPIGPGLLAAPFISLFSVIDHVLAHPVIKDHQQYQYSWSFYGFAFASAFYFLLGITLYRRSLNILKLKINSWHLLFISSSFGILFYVLFRPTMGHAYEFFGLSLCFYACAQIYRKFAQQTLAYKYVGLCAMSMVLTITIRPSNITVFLLPLIIFGFLEIQRQKQSCISIKQIAQFLAVLGSFCALCYVPIALINLKIYGVIIPTAKLMYVSHVAAPIPPLNSIHNIMQAVSYLFMHLWQIGIILFSSEFGMILTSSIIVFGLVFLIYYGIIRIAKKPVLSVFTLILIAIYCGLPVAITIFWQSVGDAYGYRFFYGLFPLALLGYAYWHTVARSKWLERLILSFCAISLLTAMLFASNPQLMYHEDGANAYGKMGGNAVGYNTAVLKSLPHTATWLNLAATRTPGFLVVGLFDLFKIDIQELRIKGLEAKFEKYRQYQHPPLSTYLQTILLSVLFIGGCWGLCRR